MTCSPAGRPPLPDGKRAHTPRGGTLARPLSTRTGHFSFRQAAQDGVADFPDANKPVAAVRIRPARAGAAINRPVLISAESRPLPLLKIDHLVHALLLCWPHSKAAFFAALKKVSAR